MAKQAELEKLTGLASRFGAFVTEQHPFALADALDAFEAATGGRDVRDEAGIEALRPALHRELTRRLQTRAIPEGLPDTTPRTSAAARMELPYGLAGRSSWHGDVIGPMIRDLGITLAMRPEPATVRMVMNSQIAKAGPPTDGKDFGYGDLDWGILLPASPLTIATLTLAGMAMAFWREGSQRVVVSLIGEGGSSLGEWHEAINLCAARRLPAVFRLQS